MNDFANVIVINSLNLHFSKRLHMKYVARMLTGMKRHALKKQFIMVKMLESHNAIVIRFSAEKLSKYFAFILVALI